MISGLYELYKIVEIIGRSTVQCLDNVIRMNKEAVARKIFITALPGGTTRNGRPNYK